MSDPSTTRRLTAGEDVICAVVLLLLDTILAFVALLTGLAHSDVNVYEPTPHASTTPIYASVAVFAGAVLVSAFGLRKLGLRVSVWTQLLAGACLLLFSAIGVWGP
ncbi:DUF6234 family protein [Streptomyces liangshanensis]|uniref:DUF6234 domain-containing protein n=1 Tax=Streptomyces liangshanensis TaxID=2717324 RepID=A0A6G9GWL3_9ACTN|nr:DUF6234 family protein [Streptomyces liangshanensis]QIQ02605.1 hypothetical protein HA039_10005 [Streptomyces liangshanensis]